MPEIKVTAVEWAGFLAEAWEKGRQAAPDDQNPYGRAPGQSCNDWPDGPLGKVPLTYFGGSREPSLAEERIEAARQALIATGYFGEDQVGDDIAPRITELWGVSDAVSPPPTSRGYPKSEAAARVAFAEVLLDTLPFGDFLEARDERVRREALAPILALADHWRATLPIKWESGCRVLYNIDVDDLVGELLDAAVFQRPVDHAAPERGRKWVDLIGIDPDYTGGKPTDQFLDEQRGEA